MSQPAQQVVLSIESRLDRVGLLARIVRWLCADACIRQTDAEQIELALVEAVNNAVQHAYREKPEDFISVVWRLYDSELHLEVSECGEAMTSVPSGDLPDPGDSGGRGWFLMRQCMGSVSYRSHDGINTVVMTKRFHSADCEHQ